MRLTTTVVRDELVRVRASKPCDRRAELAGLLRSAGTLQVLGGGRYALEAVSEHPGVARRLYEALHEAVGTRGELRLLEPGRGHPRQRYVVRAAGLSLQRLVEAGIVDERGAPSEGVPRRIVAKRCCAAAYLRGAFLARGSITDPRRSAHLEIRAGTERGALDIASMLERIGAPAKARAHHGFAAYCKAAGSIGTALAAMGAAEAYLAWEETSVWASVHAEAGRLSNADAANARRLARAAAQQRAAIEDVERMVGMRALAPALREVAELRLAHPEASLEELGRMCDPPVSKPAIADRMRRIIAIAGGTSAARRKRHFAPARSPR